MAKCVLSLRTDISVPRNVGFYTKNDCFRDYIKTITKMKLPLLMCRSFFLVPLFYNYFNQRGLFYYYMKLGYARVRIV